MTPVNNASALGLKVAPLEYKATLKENGIQQGFVDVSNPSAQSVKVRASVQAFRQIDDNGGLQFYDDEQIAAGVKTDIETFDMGPREATRLYFTVDGKLLPEGDVYAAIFLTTDPTSSHNGVGQLVRVGTILSIVNKTPGERSAKITKINLPFFQLTDTAKGTYAVKNTGTREGGFYPVVTISAWPGGKTKQQDSSLVFGGRERSNDFSYQTGFGIHSVTVEYGDSSQSQWVVLIAPWMMILALFITLIIGIELLLLKRRRAAAKISHKTTTPTS